MARVTEGIFQGVHGKLGNVVFRRVNGKTFLCKSPVFRKRKPTERELSLRKKFSFTIAFVQRLMFLLRRTYQHFEDGKTGFNRAVSHNYHEIVMGERPPYQVNYPKVVLSRGNLPLPEMMLAVSLLPGTLSFIWTNDDFFIELILKFLSPFIVKKQMNGDLTSTTQILPIVYTAWNSHISVENRSIPISVLFQPMVTKYPTATIPDW